MFKSSTVSLPVQTSGVDAQLNNRTGKNNSSHRGSGYNKGSAGNKRKMHTSRSVYKFVNKYVKPGNNINNRIKDDKLIINNSKSLNIVLRMLREGRINKS
jgi:hypothetical protein